MAKKRLLYILICIFLFACDKTEQESSKINQLETHLKQLKENLKKATEPGTIVKLETEIAKTTLKTEFLTQIKWINLTLKLLDTTNKTSCKKTQTQLESELRVVFTEELNPPLSSPNLLEILTTEHSCKETGYKLPLTFPEAEDDFKGSLRQSIKTYTLLLESLDTTDKAICKKIIAQMKKATYPFPYINHPAELMRASENPCAEDLLAPVSFYPVEMFNCEEFPRGARCRAKRLSPP